MWGVRALRFCYAFTLLASLPLIPLYGHTPAESAGSARASIYPLGGNLVAGPYRVGFRRVFRFDTTRTRQTTRDFRGDITPDLNGRPAGTTRLELATSAVTGWPM